MHLKRILSNIISAFAIVVVLQCSTSAQIVHYYYLQGQVLNAFVESSHPQRTPKIEFSQAHTPQDKPADQRSYISFTQNNNDQISALDGSYSSVSFMTVGTDRLSAIKHDSVIYYLGDHKSHYLWLASLPLALAQESEATSDFDPYGYHSSAISVSHNFGYNSEYRDWFTGLIYLRARDYDPRNQHFMTMDSYHIWNKYNFADANPITNIDPTGHNSKSLDHFIHGYFSYVFEALVGLVSFGVGVIGSDKYFTILGAALTGIATTQIYKQRAQDNKSVIQQDDYKNPPLAVSIPMYVLDTAILVKSVIALSPHWIDNPHQHYD